MTRFKPRAVFEEPALERFAFLEEEFGLVGPEIEGEVLPTVRWVSPVLRVRVMLDNSENRVTTSVEVRTSSSLLAADLEDIVDVWVWRLETMLRV